MSSVLERLRNVVRNEGFDAYIVSGSDEHSLEKVPDEKKRLAYVLGHDFEGMAFISQEHAAFLTDSRYWTEAESCLDSSWILVKRFPEFQSFIAEHLPPESVVAIDPYLSSERLDFRRSKLLKESNISFSFCKFNFVDAIWDSKPAAQIRMTWLPSLDVFPGHTSVSEKLKSVEELLISKNVNFLIMSDPTEICWLLDIRGHDVLYTPLVISYALVSRAGVALFIDLQKITPPVAAHLAAHRVHVCPYAEFEVALQLLARTYTLRMEAGPPLAQASPAPDAPLLHDRWVNADGNGDSATQGTVTEATLANFFQSAEAFTVCYDPRLVVAMVDHIPPECRLSLPSLVADLVHQKDPAEVQASRQAHLADGVAMCRFLCWLETALVAPNTLPPTDAAFFPLSEYSVTLKLLEFRKANESFLYPSFDTISQTGANAAMAHYHPTETRSSLLSPNEIYLVDSGGQYSYGATTDVTRTVHHGTPSPDEIRAYTRVLQGHIAVDSAVISAKTTGAQLDFLARMYLFKDGCNFGHSTGHGIGSCLSVHEGNFIHANHNTPLKPHIITSNEPGYYVPHKFGIRLENAIHLVETTLGTPDAPYYRFEHLSLVPFCAALIDVALLAPAEREWVNTYHAEVLENIAPSLTAEEQQWLRRVCAPLPLN